MPKSKSTRGKRMKFVMRRVPGFHTLWRKRFISMLSSLETRLYLHLHRGESSVEDLASLLRWIHTVQFIVIRRTDMFMPTHVDECVSELLPSAKACWEVAKRAKENGGRCVCTGDELKEITVAIPKVFDFIRADLENSPNACMTDWYAAGRLSDRVTAAGEQVVEITAKTCQRLYDGVVRDLLTGKLHEEYYKLLRSEVVNAE